jgi:hypothetical protein
VTISGAGLAWTLVKQSNGRLGTSEIWQAPAATQLSNVTVRSTQRFTGYDQSLTVVAFGNAAGAGASVAASAASSAPPVSTTTTKAASLAYGVGNYWDRAVGRTLGANQTSVHQWVDSNTGDTFWVQAVSGAIGSAGMQVVVNATAPANDQWNPAAVEILLK